MKAIIDDTILKVHSLAKTGEDYQLVIDNHYAFNVDGIVVFKHNDGFEILGVINEVEVANNHKILYIEINPSQSGTMKTEQVESIMLWGTL